MKGKPLQRAFHCFPGSGGDSGPWWHPYHQWTPAWQGWRRISCGSPGSSVCCPRWHPQNQWASPGNNMGHTLRSGSLHKHPWRSLKDGYVGSWDVSALKKLKFSILPTELELIPFPPLFLGTDTGHRSRNPCYRKAVVISVLKNRIKEVPECLQPIKHLSIYLQYNYLMTTERSTSFRLKSQHLSISTHPRSRHLQVKGRAGQSKAVKEWLGWNTWKTDSNTLGKQQR